MRKFPCLPLTVLILPMLAATPSPGADVALRYKTETKFNPALPIQVKEGMQAASVVPKEAIAQYSNGKLASSSGQFQYVCDFVKQEVTLLDKDGKRYATLPLSQFGDEMGHAIPEMPAQVKAMMASIKTHFESKATGRTDVIAGVEGEEHQFIMTANLPAPPNGPAATGRVVMHFWTAKASEVMRIAAIRELTGLTGYEVAAAGTAMMSGAMMQKLREMPMFGDISAAMSKEMQSFGTQVNLRMQIETFVPIMSGHDAAGVGLDPDTPFMQINTELTELSTATIPDSVFQIPDDYKSVSAADIMKGMFAGATPAPK